MLARLTQLLRFGLVVAIPLAAVACGNESANDAPIIDSVEAPLVVTEQNGSYAIPVTLLFHDNDGEAVTRLHYRLLPDIDGMIDVPAPNPTRESTEVTIVIAASALDRANGKTVDPTGSTVAARGDGHDGEHHDGNGDHARPVSRALQLWIVDGRGAESLPASSTVTLD